MSVCFSLPQLKYKKYSDTVFLGATLWAFFLDSLVSPLFSGPYFDLAQFFSGWWFS